jgi:hypothetical protein
MGNKVNATTRSLSIHRSLVGHTNPSTDFLPAICTVNAQLYQEATTQYLNRRTFVLKNAQSVQFMETWLSNIHLGFRHIRTLSLGDFDPISHTDKHCSFLARCEGLVRLSLRDCRVVHNTVRRYVNGPDELPALVVISVDCQDFEAYM